MDIRRKAHCLLSQGALCVIIYQLGVAYSLPKKLCHIKKQRSKINTILKKKLDSINRDAIRVNGGFHLLSYFC